MLDDNDIEKLIKAQKEVFVTKEEMEHLIDIVATKDELNGLKGEMKQGFDKIDKHLDLIDRKLDKVEVIEKEVDYIKNTFDVPAIKKS